jgi:hypothetical protein
MTAMPLDHFLRVLRSPRVSRFFVFDFDPRDPCSSVVRFFLMEKKIFWLLFTVLGVVMGFILPSFWWNLALTLPLLVLSWWVVYRSGWFS